MSTTIQQGLRPLFLMYFIMGLGVYPIKQPNKSRFHRWIAYLSVLYSLVIWFVYGCVLFYTFTIWPLEILFWGNFTVIIIMAINIFITITSAILIFHHQKRFQIYMEKLAVVDDTLEKLGTPKTYRKLHMLSKRVIIGWIVYTLIINIYSTMWWLKLVKQVSWGFLLPHIINHCFHINIFTDLIFIFLLWYIGTRFDKTNEHMHCLLLKEEHELKYVWKKSVIIHGYFLHRHNYKRTFWTSMHLHLELCRIARELNVIFGMQITLDMLSYFAALTSLCHFLYRILEKKHQIKKILRPFIGVGVRFLIYVIRLYAVNHICESVKNKAKNIDKIIHQLTNTFRYSDIWKEIDFFVLQVTQHPLKFTRLGLVNLGYKFLQKFFTSILTYVIIMIQLNVQSMIDSYKPEI